ncbi:sulfur relay, TusB/DsrH family protein [Rodentibacter pneumotropicus]|uniref:Sulfur relay, TusB/DsrH family protein n=1 Tax=Rodentibacter pneumotropicus TaxID=758 RepID=A0A448MTF2_9PAST|nr:sulfur relay, TusB/DsrH family protein [Rodentibacter pneumotropicus]
MSNILHLIKKLQKAIITHLYDNGFFELKDAVMFVSDNLNLTKYAIYKHLRELKGE